MENKYFGKLPLELYENKKLEEIIDYLSENKVCTKTAGVSYIVEHKKTNDLGVDSSKINHKEAYSSLNFEDNLINELYRFLLTHYTRGLGDYIMVDLNLSKETFGMPYKDKRNIALKYFNLYFGEISIPIQFSFTFDDDRNIIPATNFQKLKRVRDELKGNLTKNIDLLLPYLAGELSFFNRELFETNTTITKIFHFENILKILIKINNEYKFEEDDIFTPPPISKIIYEEYSDQFHCLKQVKFIENQITSNEKVNRAFIVSLFHFFSNKLKIKTPSGKIFGEIINNYFGCDFGEIGLNGSEGNRHYTRIENFKNEWESFTN
ncbi:hypothetical protein BTO04_05050 [Polaribacter sp. SA4-10]|uniref:hypothetical protein n=1 Tax=Polaribacter sp. SA4-10 TaxID=754397 RepID=UPI000B3D2D25|nr:hypothetical protein [Polaribacter sp. SA4-10]ARV06108.1 hypothetical protein BTO04_05050 [Polaribacter sp. SA4-10]